MVRVYDKNGVAFLEGNLFDLKIDGSRRIYLKTKDKNSYVFSGHTCEPDKTIDYKKEFLVNFNQMLENQYYKEKELDSQR